MTEQELDFWHDQGKVPDWWYYQKSTKPLWMKWQEQEEKFLDEIQERKNNQEQEKQLESQIAEVVEDKLLDMLSNLQL